MTSLSPNRIAELEALAEAMATLVVLAASMTLKASYREAAQEALAAFRKWQAKEGG